MMELEVRVLDLDNQEILGVVGPVLIRVFRGATEPAHIERGRDIIAELLAHWPVAGLLVVAHHGARIPDGSTRRLSSLAFGSFGERLVIAQAVLGLGFWAEAARMTATVVSRLIGRPIMIESSVEAAAQLLSFELIGIDPAPLVAAHDRMLAQLDEASASRAAR